MSVTLFWIQYYRIRDRSFFMRKGGGGDWWDFGEGHQKKSALKGGPCKKNKGKGGVT